MNSSTIKKKSAVLNSSYIILPIISLCALLATFLVTNSNVTFQTKVTVFGLVVLIYLMLCTTLWVRQNEQLYVKTTKKKSGVVSTTEIEAKLLALEEAKQFFGASLKTADMFRFIASRVNEIIPYSAGTLCLADEKKEKLKIACVIGDDLKKLVGSDIDLRRTIAWKAFQSRKAQIDKTLQINKNEISVEAFKSLNSAVAVPLSDGKDIYGVFVLYGKAENDFDQNSLQLFEAVGTRIAPLLMSARTFENSLINALTDTLTNLPNERAFFLVLENQIAESQRFHDKRPLTILTIDIRHFDEHNQRFGHATGDRLLLFVANKIKNQLRQMDFLARSMNDEFLAVLPTASEEITREIIGRVEKAFVTNPFEISNGEKIHLQLSLGAASFGKDGETANEMLQHALVRKQQSKSDENSSKILWFPKDYLN
jgi:diguanylate cyclase (GGDEF)-like protein